LKCGFEKKLKNALNYFEGGKSSARISGRAFFYEKQGGLK